MKTRRDLILLTCSALTGLALIPDHVSIRKGQVVLGWREALAGNGNGNGNSGGNGNGGGNGSGGSGNGGSGNGGGGKGNGQGGNSAGNDRDSPAGSSSSKGSQSNALSGGEPDRGLAVRHANGTTEQIVDGRYEMRDARSRTIVNRRATTSDRSRLESLTR
jgi:hypothetical protein